MLKFSNTPPDDPRGHALPIVRTPAGKKFAAVITSDDIVGCNTHFWGGKTVPCEVPDCEACKNGMPYRWHAYCSAVLQPSGLHVLYETTALAAENLVTFRRSNGTLRGCLIDAYRWRGSANGRVIIKCERTSQALDTLPPEPNLIRCLAIIWQLPENGVACGDATPFGANLNVACAKGPMNHPPNKGPSDAA